MQFNTRIMTEKQLRELDAWIAEYVFGWSDIKMENAPNEVSSLKPPFGRSPVGYSQLPHFSTFRMDAMLVLERCVQEISWNRIVSIGTTSDGDYFINYSDSEPNSEAFCACEAETLPLAICLFAKQLFSK